MKLQELLKKLVKDGAPAQASAVYLTGCPDAQGENFADAIKDAECVFVDNAIFQNPPGLFIGSTSYLANSINHLTIDDIDNCWPQICKMMDW